jgi:type I restriction enzyme R subunit
MQTIARANRVFKDKTNGLIVDYIGVFRDLQKALAIYGSGVGGATAEGEMPIRDKQQLVRMLKKGIEETTVFCNKLGIDPAKIRAAEGMQKLELLNDAVDSLLASDETKKKYMAMVGNINKLYSAILPDPMAGDFNTERKTFEVLAANIRALMPEGDISDIMEDINSLLDRSIDTKPYEIYTTEKVDLSRLDIDALKKLYDRRHKRIVVEQLRWDVEARIKRMIVLNKSRMNYLEQLQRMIEDYNSGSLNVQLFFDKLMALVMELNEEERRGVKEQLSEEELALFDILTKPEMDMAEKDKNQVKKVARELLTTLHNRLVIDWRKRQQTRAEVLVTIRDILDELPRVYSPEIYDRKCDLVYQHIYDSYYGEGHSVYA